MIVMWFAIGCVIGLAIGRYAGINVSAHAAANLINDALKEGKLIKGGVNRTFQFDDRPPPPAPLRRGG